MRCPSWAGGMRDASVAPWAGPARLTSHGARRAPLGGRGFGARRPQAQCRSGPVSRSRAVPSPSGRRLVVSACPRSARARPRLRPEGAGGAPERHPAGPASGACRPPSPGGGRGHGDLWGLAAPGRSSSRGASAAAGGLSLSSHAHTITRWLKPSDAFCLKPVGLQELGQTIRRVLRQRREQGAGPQEGP